MSDLNKVILIGRLVKDVELRTTKNNTSVARFRIAVSRPPNSRGEKETDFIDVVVWDKQAEQCNQYIFKGWLVSVEGRLQIREFTTQDGQKKKSTEVVATRVYFLRPPKNTDRDKSPEVLKEEDNVDLPDNEDDVLNNDNV